jgi:hypothetical protein
VLMLKHSFVSFASIMSREQIVISTEGRDLFWGC